MDNNLTYAERLTELEKATNKLVETVKNLGKSSEVNSKVILEHQKLHETALREFNKMLMFLKEQQQVRLNNSKEDYEMAKIQKSHGESINFILTRIAEIQKKLNM